MSISRHTRKSNIEHHGGPPPNDLYSGLAHSATPQELVDLENFLNKVIPPTNDDGSGTGNL